MNVNFWKDKRVFITGHTGFKGGWLSLWLQKMGAIVTGYSLDVASKPNFFEIADVSCNMNSIINDIRDLSCLKTAIKFANPDIVFHLAAQSLVRQSYIDPVDTFSINIMGTVNLLESLRNLPNIKSVVVVSTDKCYENKEWSWPYRENDKLGGHDPYSNSKSCVELITSSYNKSFLQNEGISVATARAGNVIGGGDWSDDRLFPDMIRAFNDKKPVIIRNPNAIRPWQHVLEPLNGYLTLAEKLYSDGIIYTEGWNFGPNTDDAKPVNWIVENVVSSWGQDASWKLDYKVNPHEANYLKLDISKAKAKLNWEPKWTLSLAIEETISWYKSIPKFKNMRYFSLNQIDKFN